MLEIPRIGLLQPVAQSDLRVPPKSVDLAHVQQLAGRPVGLARVELEFALVADDVGDQLGQFADRQVLPTPTLIGSGLVVVLAAGTGRPAPGRRRAGTPDAASRCPQTVTDGAPASLASWKRRIRPGSTWESAGSKLSPGP